MIRVTPKSAAELLAPYFAACQGEAVAVLHLDSGLRLLAATFGPLGEAESVDLGVRDMLAAALRLGAASIVLVHNHPSGDPSPSEEDRRATRRLAEAAAAVGLRLADHVIVAGGERSSFRELNLL